MSVYHFVKLCEKSYLQCYSLWLQPQYEHNRSLSCMLLVIHGRCPPEGIYQQFSHCEAL